MPVSDPGSPTQTTGDVHLVRDGETIDFDGKPHQAFSWLVDLPLKVEAALQSCYGPDRLETTIHRIMVTLGDGSTVTVDETGLTRIITPGGYWLDIQRPVATDGPLAGHAHLDFYLIANPASFATASGVVPRFRKGDNPATYLVNPVAPPPADPEPSPLP